MEAAVNLIAYRRGWLRPKNEVTLEQLRRGEAPELDDVEFYGIDEDLYERHFQLFNDLHRVCGVGGDDFTADEIEPERLPCVIRTLKTYPCANDRELEEMLDRMWGLCYRAEKAGVSAFLVL